MCAGKVAGLVQSTTPGEYSYSRPGEMLRCPWHGWEYDLRTGQSWWNPGKTRVRSYDVTVETGEQLGQDLKPPAPGLEKGPYVAETYPVSVERQYVVVTVDL